MKNATDQLMTYRDNSDGSRTIIMNDFAKYLISERLHDFLMIRSWKIDNDNIWSADVETAGGSRFIVTGTSILDCIDKANERFGGST